MGQTRVNRSSQANILLARITRLVSVRLPGFRFHPILPYRPGITMTDSVKVHANLSSHVIGRPGISCGRMPLVHETVKTPMTPVAHDPDRRIAPASTALRVSSGQHLLSRLRGSFKVRGPIPCL